MNGPTGVQGPTGPQGDTVVDQIPVWSATTYYTWGNFVTYGSRVYQWNGAGYGEAPANDDGWICVVG